MMAVGMAAMGRDDAAIVEEQVGDRDRLVEQTARVVAQIQDVALEARPDIRWASRISRFRLSAVSELKL